MIDSGSGTVVAPLSPTVAGNEPGSRPRVFPGGGPLEPGQEFGERYRILELLGLGGMGAVYRAWDAELEIEVAIKVVRPEVAADPAAAAALDRRFKRELLLAREVTHRNVVRIHDLGEIDGIKYITMSLLEGEDLKTILEREQRLPVSTALPITRDVVAGLVAAHQAGVVHRDLKPANIMVSRATHEAVIMDFGVARFAGDPAAAATGPEEAPVATGPAGIGQTAVGSVVGTFEYMAPEQLRGEEVDQRADLYTLGLILYDMLHGRPGGVRDAFAEAQRRARQAPPPLRQLDPAIPEPLDKIVSRCLEPRAEDRYQSSRELARDLDRLDDEGHLKPVDRRLTRRLVASAAVVMSLLLAATWWLAGSRAPREPPTPMSILVADFDNRSGDPAFDGAVEQALGIAMEGAGFINAYPRPSALEIVRQLQPDGRLDESMARLVARREGVDVILAGTLDERGSGYRITVLALDATLEPEGMEALARAGISPRSKEEVLPAVARLAADLRRRLGDTEPESARLAEAETFTAASLEAMRAYAVGQQLAFQGKFDEAVTAYEEALGFDPDFGRAYAGIAVVLANLGEGERSQDYFAQAMARIDRMTEREKSRTRGGYFLMTGNHLQAAEEYETLLAHYPADTAGRANLALAYFFQRNMTRALEEGRLAVELNPKNVPQRNNVALYAMYAGDFESAAEEAQAVIDLNPAFLKAYVARAVSELGQGHPELARETYGQLEQISPRGASLAALGRGDLALFAGRNAAAVEVLEEGIALDRTHEFDYDEAVKLAALAEAHLGSGDRAAALRAASRAVETSRSPGAVVPAARVFLAAGQGERALELARDLGERLEPDPRAYARVLEGEALLAAGQPREALDRLLEAQQIADTWLGRFDLGRAYLELGAFTEAHSAFDACFDRRGESTAVFLDDRPSYRFFPPLMYYLGRVQEELGSPAALESYSSYLQIKQGAEGDLLAADARRRLEALSPRKAADGAGAKAEATS